MKATRAQLAAIFGVTPPAIDGWVRRGCPVHEPSKGPGRGKGAKFWVPDVVAWRDTHIVLKGAIADTGEQPQDLRNRLLRTQTESAELDLAVKRGELIEVTEYRDALESTYQRVGARLKGVKPKLASAVVGVTTVQEGFLRVDPLIDEVLAELSTGDDIPEVVESDDDPPEATAAA